MRDLSVVPDMTIWNSGLRDGGLGKRLASAAGRSILSTIVIGVVAVGVFAIRYGRYRFDEIEGIVAQNQVFLGAIFGSLFIWNFWFREPPKSNASGRER